MTTISTQPLAAAESGADPRLFELRTYHAAPGKLDALNARFRDHTCKLFEKHGMQNIGYWVPVDNPGNVLVYLLAYPSQEAREASWKAFLADEDWKSVDQTSTKGGRLVQRVESVYLKPTDYSAAYAVTKEPKVRAFELRTYKASPGKLPALHQRFRDHTVQLFRKHGMTQLAYWTPVKPNQGRDDTLIYLLAHTDQAARDKSFAAFREDPDWIAAKSASEKDGSLTAKVDSLMLVPTDYSQTR